jgi:hypothetical protein
MQVAVVVEHMRVLADQVAQAEEQVALDSVLVVPQVLILVAVAVAVV